jgi:acetyl esterase/lipase
MSLDPSAFRPESIEPETAALIAELEALAASQPPMHTRDPKEVRAEREKGMPGRPPIVRSPNAKVRTIPGPAGQISLRFFLPPRVEGVYLYIHGGGFVLGSNDAQDPRLEAIANNCNVVVVAPSYRLAPENPYPAGPDDCEAAALWLTQNAKAEYGTERLLIGGGSAGAHLAVVSMLRLRDRHGLRPFAAADLVFGWYDVGLTPSAANWGERNLVLSTPIMHWFADHFVPAQRRREPDVSPIHANLRDMPPALFSVGTMDVLLDDTLFMYSRWLAAGNEAEIAVYPGGVHGFTGFGGTLGRRAAERQDAFIRDALGAKARVA